MSPTPATWRRYAATALLAVWVAACGHRYDDTRGPRYAGLGLAGGEPATLTVVTFNIERGARVREAIDELRSDPALRDADIVLLQEMDAPGTDAVARALAMHYVYYPASNVCGRDVGNAILSRWPILHDRKILLPHPNPLDGRRRYAVRAIVAAPRGPLLVYSVHADPVWMSIRGRIEQARHVLDDADSFDLPAVVGGDFNTLEPESVASVVEDYRMLGFHWASREVVATADYVFGSVVLDHVFARDLEPIAAGSRPSRASDHRPVWVRLRRRGP